MIARLNNGKRRLGGIGRYNMMFLLAAVALLLCFVPFGRTMVNEIDGVQQHYSALCYVRQMLLDLFSGNGFKQNG